MTSSDAERQRTLEQYEFRKHAWIAKHPEATSAEYEAAIKKIAEECGV